MTGRRVVANIALSLDGRVHGAGGEFDDSVDQGGSWALASSTVTGSGAICLLYDRTR
jgi:hypothetical protein